MNAVATIYLLSGLFFGILNWRHRPESDNKLDAFNVAMAHLTWWMCLGPAFSFVVRLRREG